jgi:hypothetical protein
MGLKGKLLLIAFYVILFIGTLSVKIMEALGFLNSGNSVMNNVVAILSVIVLWSFVYWRFADIVESKKT